MSGGDTALDALSEEPADRFSIAVAILAVVTTLVAAVVGILFATSSNESESLTSKALRHALAASQETDRANLATREQFALLEEWRTQAVSARVARERRLLEGDDPRSSLAREEEGWQELARSTATEIASHAGETGLTGVGPDSLDAPERDEFFPYRLLSRAEQESIEEIALRDAANAASADWGQRSASYAAILTLLAVALYLFGFALTPQGRSVRGLFAAAGVAFLVVCVIFGPVRALASPSLATDTAAETYADAQVRLFTAQDRADYRVAADRFTDAIELRPDFADAYIGRADALFLAESTQVAAFTSLSSPEALKQGLEDYRMARELGVQTSTTIGNIGFHLFELGLLEDDPTMLEESLTATQEAIDARPDDPVLRFNYAVTLLALGEYDASVEAYEEALRATAEKEGTGQRFQWIAGALTDLALVSLHGPPELVDDVQRMRELIVAEGGTEATDQGSSEATVEAMRAVVQPGRVETVIGRSSGLDVGDVVTERWNHLDPDALSWADMESVSITQSLLADGDEGFYTRTFLGLDCLRSGEYRVDLYHEGTLIGQALQTLNADYELFANHDADVYGCVPSGLGGRARARQLDPLRT